MQCGSTHPQIFMSPSPLAPPPRHLQKAFWSWTIWLESIWFLLHEGGICITKKIHILLDLTDSFIVWISYFGCWRCQINAAKIASHSHSHGVNLVSSLFAIFLQSRLGTRSLCYRPQRTGSGDQARFTDRQRHIPAVSKSYERISADRTKQKFDVTFLVTFETLFRRLRVVLWQKLV